MLRDFQNKFNEHVDKHNRRNTYYYYAARRNPDTLVLTQSVASPMVISVTPLEHSNGSEFVSSVDPGDSKTLWTCTGPSGLYNCAFHFFLIRPSPVDTELTIQFRENGLEVPGWEVYVPVGNTSISGNLFLPCTNGAEYSIWFLNDEAAESIIVHSCEFTGRPLVPLMSEAYTLE